MNTRHTPGPWNERTRTLITLDGCDQREEVIEIASAASDETLAYVPFGIEGHPPFPDDQAEANARLITKAPELAAALRRLADRVEQIELPDGSTPDTFAARALLAEIDGEDVGVA